MKYVNNALCCLVWHVGMALIGACVVVPIEPGFQKRIEKEENMISAMCGVRDVRNAIKWKMIYFYVCIVFQRTAFCCRVYIVQCTCDLYVRLNKQNGNVRPDSSKNARACAVFFNGNHFN